MTKPRWKRRSEGSNRRNEDQSGRMTVRTSDNRIHGFAEAQEGIAGSLCLPVEVPGAVGSPANAIGTI